jgi:AAHS family 4-hydroxybenzoate transporter-like MFS transporter
MLWLTYFMGLLIFYLLTSWMPVLMKEVGFSIERAAFMSALFPLGGGIGAVAVGWLMDRMNPHAVIAAAYALTTVFVFTIGRGTSSLAILAALIFLAGVDGQDAMSTQRPVTRKTSSPHDSLGPPCRQVSRHVRMSL